LPSEEKGLEGRPEALNLVTIYAALADSSVAEVLAQYGGQGFGAFKPALGELLVETLRPITARFTGLLDDREALDAILARGAAKAREIAGPTLEGTYKALGLLRG
jgi:tryptophanyl-tRNA synthetase